MAVLEFLPFQRVTIGGQSNRQAPPRNLTARAWIVTGRDPYAPDRDSRRLAHSQHAVGPDFFGRRSGERGGVKFAAEIIIPNVRCPAQQCRRNLFPPFIIVPWLGLRLTTHTRTDLESAIDQQPGAGSRHRFRD